MISVERVSSVPTFLKGILRSEFRQDRGGVCFPKDHSIFLMEKILKRSFCRSSYKEREGLCACKITVF
ncbi:hypothetical protein CH380_13130 [Leptospira adleri]|uniref:Uncharacterized protein n=1 Tax=Leptospira adleri TaxID=2023186 RepID=A0A2M9YMC3_9LEPT|nr:hypothetical protein CH380_13130 [Leptospira adleri]PJZ60483.1 hypothetical protein CH376_18155 [Leptospira adleri]